ncbi:hypothetical protein NDU88_002705 [Pleurodeles waltl]|uniref:Uncharacterized protein n=1 Tax=Pleurodeles waltl TaxID=8319 RepID=A0AAV7VEK2_PLEWA|nr:hypothetical protein NDU88_002705 [Pleurodeles waltl]
MKERGARDQLKNTSGYDITTVIPNYKKAGNLLTSRPIRIEGSRDVRGRPETQKESGAGRRDSAVLSPAPRGPCC